MVRHLLFCLFTFTTDPHPVVMIIMSNGQNLMKHAYSDHLMGFHKHSTQGQGHV